MLDRNGPKPLYQQVKEHLIRRIREGEYAVHRKIPSERHLCEQFGVSRITVRQALDELIKQGYLYRYHGRGTFVAEPDPKFNQPLEEVIRFEELLRLQGSRGWTEIVSAGGAAADLPVANILDLPAGTRVFRLKLIGHSTDGPVVFYDSFFHPELERELREIIDHLSGGKKPFSSIDLYREFSGERPSRVRQILEATGAEEWVADHLKVDRGTALMKVQSVFLTREGRPLEFRHAYYQGNKYLFHINRSLRWS